MKVFPSVGGGFSRGCLLRQLLGVGELIGEMRGDKPGGYMGDVEEGSWSRDGEGKRKHDSPGREPRLELSLTT